MSFANSKCLLLRAGKDFYFKMSFATGGKRLFEIKSLFRAGNPSMDSQLASCAGAHAAAHAMPSLLAKQA